MAGRLGDNASLASRVGSDASGDEILRLLDAYPVDTSLVQRDAVLPTGTVSVSFSEDDQPAYRIHEGVAWDALELTPSWRRIAGEADAVCFGTLAQRSAVSKQTIQSLVSMCRADCLRVFDMNLRYPFFSADTIQWSLNNASVLKMNEEELEIVLRKFDLTLRLSPDPEREGVEVIMTAFPIDLVCLTLGSRGSLIVSRGGHYRHPGLAAQVVDTIGAGDAFLATVVNYALRNAPLDVMSEAANRCAAWVASQPDAIPDSSLPSLT
jgi:fructokinase